MEVRGERDVVRVEAEVGVEHRLGMQGLRADAQNQVQSRGKKGALAADLALHCADERDGLRQQLVKSDFPLETPYTA